MKTVLLIGALVGATALVYRNTLPGQFIYDDHAIVAKNPLIRDLNNIPLIFGTSYWGTHIGLPKELKGGLYRPLTVITFALNYWAGGLNPCGYHLVNLVLHIGVSILVGLLGIRFGMSWRGSAVAAFLFALLPIHTEAVSNVVGRSELLTAFFILLAWYFSTGTSRYGAIALGALSFALALLSKENAVAFLPVLLVSDYVIYQIPWRLLCRKRLLVWTTYFGVLLLYLEWKHFIIGSIANAGTIPYFDTHSVLITSLTMAKFVVTHYLKPLILGISLCADFTRPALADVNAHDLIAWFYSLVLVGLCGGFCYIALKHQKRAGLYGLIFILFLIPVLNFLVPLEVIGAERFLYLPSVGYCWGIGLIFEKLFKISKPWAMAASLGMLLWYSERTFERNKAWETEESFWKTTLQDAPQSPRAWNGMGTILMNQKKYDEAIPFFEHALNLNPLLMDALYNMATCYFMKKEYVRAKGEYLRVLIVKPYDPNTLFHLGYLAEQEHDLKSAVDYYAILLTINPLDQAIKNKLDFLENTIRHKQMKGSYSTH
jgi:hypothetical protein